MCYYIIIHICSFSLHNGMCTISQAILTNQHICIIFFLFTLLLLFKDIVNRCWIVLQNVYKWITNSSFIVQRNNFIQRRYMYLIINMSSCLYFVCFILCNFKSGYCWPDIFNYILEALNFDIVSKHFEFLLFPVKPVPLHFMWANFASKTKCMDLICNPNNF